MSDSVSFISVKFIMKTLAIQIQLEILVQVILIQILNEFQLSVNDESDIVTCRHKIRTIATEIGFSNSGQSLVETVVSELAHNIITYAGKGQIILKHVEKDGKDGIIVIAKDEGPGIADIGLALKDGHSSGHGLGLGLPGIRDMMDEFQITSEVGKGTIVTAAKWTPGIVSPMRKIQNIIDFGNATSPFPMEPVSGDAFTVMLIHDRVLVAVVDGLGHGMKAAISSWRAILSLERNIGKSVIELINKTHRELLKIGGKVAMTVAYIDLSANVITWAGIGNVDGVIYRADQHASPYKEVLIQRHGVVGYKIPNPHVYSLPLNPQDTIIFSTDGIARLRNGLYLTSPTQEIADHILAEYGKDTDDALVLVIRYLGGPSRS